MSYRYYDETPSRGSRIQDPSIDAWFRELRGDAPPAPEPRSAVAASRKRQRELDTEVEAWFRGGGPDVGPRPGPPTDSWDVDTRAWTPDWDNGSTAYLPRPASKGRGAHHRHAARDRRSTGEQPRVPAPLPAQPPAGPHVGPPLDGRRSTGEQPRIAERRPQRRAIEARAIEARPSEPRAAEVHDLNEAREARAARVAAPRSSSSGPSMPAEAAYDTGPLGGYVSDYDYADGSGPDYRTSMIPAPASSPAGVLPTPPATIPAYSATASAPSPVPAYIPAPTAAHAGYTAAPPSTQSFDGYSSGFGTAPHVQAPAPYSNGSLATASGYAEQHELPSYDSLLPEPRQPDRPDSQFDVVLPDTAGNPMLAFKNGQWFKLGAGGITSSPITVRSAVLEYSDLAGSVVQILCWWMRENSRRERSLDIATELALAVTELTHMADLRKKTPAFY